MDLKELKDIAAKRHPWEIARLSALRRILRAHLCDGMKVLDVGCGDGFISRGLFGHLNGKEITAVDINFTDERIGALDNLSGSIRYLKRLPEEGPFDLILLLDVVEHVEDDKGFLSDLVDRHVSRGGKVMITVPAFQFLYGRHDAFLGHYRRYRLQGLEMVARSSGLKILSSSYLFSSLLFPKLLLYKLLETGKETDGVGHWGGGKLLTGLMKIVLNADNLLLLAAGRLGIKIPGLTGWVLCEKQG